MEHITRFNVIDKISFRYAILDDLDPLMALYERFYAEAVYKDLIEWDAHQARGTIERGVMHRIRPHLVAEAADTEKMIGFISWELDHSFSVKPVGVLFEFYVVPEYRRSAIGRALLLLTCREMMEDGACAFHAPVASGIEAAKSLKNLFVKCGFSELGFVMRRGL